MKNIFFLIILSVFMISCGTDDDICDSGEGTSRMKISFKKGNKETTLDSLNISVNLGGSLVDLGWSKKVDHIFVPLRVDDAPYTDLYIKTTNSKKVSASKVRVNYKTKAIYVSPGCGAKINYTDLNSELLIPNSVINLEAGQNFIENEDKTNLFLIF